MTSPPGGAATGPSRLRLIALILEGYAYLGLIVAIFLAAPAFLVWGVLTRRPFIALAAILVGVPVAATAARAVRALWLPFHEPKGIEVGPHFGARLHREVQNIASRIGSPTVHRVVVTDAHNASAMQLPRAGVFWPRNTLCLGYPLLATLSVEQMRAVIAHELGHMTHAHGRVSSWVHRTRLSWVRLLDVLERHQSVPAHVHLLFRHYVPRLHAHAAVVSRQQELLADRLAAEVCGRDVAASTLIAIEIGHYVFSEHFWPRIVDRVAEEQDPPGPFSQMGPHLRTAVADPGGLLDRLVGSGTTGSETHPPLRDRLQAMQQAARWPDPPRLTAAEHFFGPQKRELAAAFDERWRTTHGRQWRTRHAEIRRRRARLAELAAAASPSPAQTFERGVLSAQEGDIEAALRCYMSAHEHGHAEAGMAAGRLLLEREDASGIALIGAAMEADPGHVEDGCRSIADFLERHGRLVDAYRYRRRATHRLVNR